MLHRVERARRLWRGHSIGIRGLPVGSVELIVASSVTGLGCCAALVAFRRGRRSAYLAAKISASMGFVAVALLGGAVHNASGAVVLGGLIIAAVGDGVMVMSRKRAFLAGLACFAIAYCAYGVAFLMRGVGSTFVVVLALAMSGSAAVGTWRYLRAHLAQKLRPFVIAYFTVMALMLGLGIASAYSTSNGLLLLGVILVATSDIAVARQRFISASFSNKLIGLPAYYVGQTLIALGVGMLAT